MSEPTKIQIPCGIGDCKIVGSPSGIKKHQGVRHSVEGEIKALQAATAKAARAAWMLERRLRADDRDSARKANFAARKEGWAEARAQAKVEAGKAQARRHITRLVAKTNAMPANWMAKAA